MNRVYAEIRFPAAPGEEPLEAAFSAPEEALFAWRADEVPALLGRVASLAAAGRWLIGFVAYEAAPGFDAALTVQDAPAGLPLAAFAAFRGPAESRPRRAFLAGSWRDAMPAPTFDAALASIRRDIAAGRFYQVNLTTRLTAPFLGDPAALFDALRAAQPGAYGVFLDLGRWQVCSVSPELFFHWRAGVSRRLSLRPMKGTAPRHVDPAADRAAGEALAASEKDRAENLMIVDLLRNDAGRIARPGSVRVPELFAVEPWRTVWQMTSAVECETRPEAGLAEVFAALFPCGSVTGAPKVEAMKAIRDLEPGPRGVYCGALGVVLPGGEARFNVAIRTVVVDGERGIAECGIGSGIVADSTAVGERDEWRVKQRFLREACPDYELFETLLLRHGRYRLRREHLARIAASARALGFVWDPDRAEAALDALAAARPAGHWRVRLRLTMDGAVSLDHEPFVRERGTQTVALAARPVDADDPRLRHKTSRRRIYDERAIPGAFDTLLWNERGEATEFTRGNLVARLDGRLVTPPASCGLLPGTFRAALLARGTIAEQAVTLEDLERAGALWFVNALRGAVRVRLDRTMRATPTTAEGER